MLMSAWLIVIVAPSPDPPEGLGSSFPELPQLKSDAVKNIVKRIQLFVIFMIISGLNFPQMYLVEISNLRFLTIQDYVKGLF